MEGQSLGEEFADEKTRLLSNLPLTSVANYYQFILLLWYITNTFQKPSHLTKWSHKIPK